MNAIKGNPKVASRGSLRGPAVIALLFLSACEGFLETAEDDFPVVATYEVSLSKTQLAVSIDASGNFATTEPVTVMASCRGQNLAAGCDQNHPDWRASFASDAEAGFLTVNFVDATQPATTATVTVNVQQYFKTYGMDRNPLADPRSLQIQIYPSSVPADMTVAGNQTIALTIQQPGPPPRQEQTPADPRLSAPQQLGLVIQGTTEQSTTESGTITYSGPLANLVEASIIGSGRSKFTLLSPAVPFIFKAGQSSVNFSVRFQPVDTADTIRYDATLILKTDNGASAAVALTGRREPGF